MALSGVNQTRSAVHYSAATLPYSRYASLVGATLRTSLFVHKEGHYGVF